MENLNLENYKLEGEELEIKLYPEPILLKKTKPIESIDNELAQLAKNMLFTMYNAPGIGLAGPQIGKDKRMFVLDVDYEREESTSENDDTKAILSSFNPMVFINPEITPIGEEKIKYQEGCLSLPGIYDDVTRYKNIQVDFMDINGEKKTLEADGLLSICIQHEKDHLDGIMFIDHLSLLKKNFYKKKFSKKK